MKVSSLHFGLTIPFQAMIMMIEEKCVKKLVKSSPLHEMEASSVIHYLFVFIFIFSLLHFKLEFSPKLSKICCMVVGIIIITSLISTLTI